MPRGVRVHRVVGAHRAEGRLPVEAARRLVGRELDHPEDGAIARGPSTTGRAAASAAPALEAGAPSVTHRFVSAKSGRPGIVSTCGDGPSLTKIERPRASWPVTTRRIGLIMAGLYTGGESPWPIS